MNLYFKPHLNLLRITQRKLRRVLGWLILVFLIVFGIYGIWAWLGLGYINVFYISLLTDMFLIYSWQRKDERVNKIKLSEEEIDVSMFLDEAAHRTLEKSWLFAFRKSYRSLRPIHLFASFLKEKNFKKILKRLDCDPKKLFKKLRLSWRVLPFFLIQKKA